MPMLALDEELTLRRQRRRGRLDRATPRPPKRCPDSDAGELALDALLSQLAHVTTQNGFLTDQLSTVSTLSSLQRWHSALKLHQETTTSQQHQQGDEVKHADALGLDCPFYDVVYAHGARIADVFETIFDLDDSVDVRKVHEVLAFSSLHNGRSMRVVCHRSPGAPDLEIHVSASLYVPRLRERAEALIATGPGSKPEDDVKALWTTLWS